MRTMRHLIGLAALAAAGLVATNGISRAAANQPVVHVQAVVKDGSVHLEAKANGPFEYSSFRPSENLYVLDLSGVSSGDSAGARVVPSELIKSYRLMNYQSGEKPVVRIEVLLSAGVQPQVERVASDELSLLVSSTPTRDVPKVSSEKASSPSLVSASATQAAPASNSAYQAIQRVNLARNGSQTQVTVVGSGELAYHVMRLQNPDRLVLDFSGSRMRAARRHIASNLDPVKDIRLAQFTPQVSRMVIDLREPARYNVGAAGNAVTVSFDQAVPAGMLKDVPSAPVSGLFSAKAASEPAAAQALPVPSTALPAALTQASSGLASPAAPASQQQAIAAARAANGGASASSGGAASDPIPVRAGDNAPVVATSAAAPQANGVTMGQPEVKYTGEPISVNLKDVDLQDFFRLIHEISGLNVVVDPNVKGTTTIVLTDVPWDQALDIVLHNGDLDKQLDGNVLRIATKETLRKEADEQRDLVKAQAEAVDLVTETRVLSYAKSDDMIKVLKQFLSPRGDVLSDPRSNTVIIRDIPSVMPAMDNLMRQLDRKSQQVEIEARVVQASRSFSREIGTQFGFNLTNLTGGNLSQFGGLNSVGTSPTMTFFPPILITGPPPVGGGPAPTKPNIGTLPLNTNLGTGAPTSGMSYTFASENFALDMMITAAEDRGVGKLISRPKIFTQNNQKGTVADGVKIPVQTIVNNTVSVQFVDAVLKLEVTPQITKDGTIFMDVIVTNDQVDQSIPRVQGIPAIDTQSTETQVTVDDGATVVIGGVDVSQQRTDVQQVPLVGSIPLLGNLFKHTTVSSQDQELWFFLTPRILPE